VLLDELDEAVGGVEAQLHPAEANTNVCSCPGGSGGPAVDGPPRRDPPRRRFPFAPDAIRR
jgi:hypothetical protein